MDRLPAALPDSIRLADRLAQVHAIDGLAFGDLSDFFNPFLRHFVREALQGGGEVWLSRDGALVDGLLLYNHVEKVGSIFTRSGATAEGLFALKDSLATFAEFPLAPKAETYYVCASDAAGASDAHRFSHRVRLARRSELPDIVRVLHEMYGRIDTSWLQASSPEEDKCLVVEVAGELAGLGWVSVVDHEGRLHSLTVRPRYRRMGIGTDLWHARMLWAHRAGARRVISEISEHNVASLAIAAAGGMQRIGRLYLSRKPSGGSLPTSG